MKTQVRKNSTTQTPASSYALRLIAALLVAGMTVGLGIAIFMLSPSTQGLETIVAAHMANSGVTHPVTAVLLNFRGYDTFLEMAVLLMALIGAWSLAPVAETRLTKPGAVLDYLARLLTPLIVVTASYLLWAGSHSPGGAFQAGALLAALGVLLNLSGWRLPVDSTNVYLRGLLVCGLVAFLLAATIRWCSETVYFFYYPPKQAGVLILFIEFFAALSIGATLAILFLLGRTEPDQ